ncbi:MAG TPA: polysaccharide ABC transporter ATP-binding protein [Verrucomicrobiae bacterium]|nr:polysaccharide ABC transporter ATP-binding protein [Verrucomicrobiae bacterium]
MSTAISAAHVSKRYVIGHQRQASDGLRHVLENALRNPFKWLANYKQRQADSHEEFWALKDVSFDIQQGDSMAIIGRNGAGKSTLLKVLSRITEPTKGRIQIRGRMASLLEVGTGFHQELTGRENIFLNGAILGMSKGEITRKFDEIVAFSEVERFLDTPVKRYSSGMYVRLAFAVAAHLEPEVLIVDEVLAVGDTAFQKKCFGKMGDVARSGRTVLFVSHNMSAVQSLCRKAIYLESGKVAGIGDVAPLVSRYLANNDPAQNRHFTKAVNLGPALKLLAYSFAPDCVTSGDRVGFNLKIRAEAKGSVHDLAILIYSAQNVRVAMLDLRCLGVPKSLEAGEEWHIEGEIKSLPLVEGDYSAGLYISASDFMENLFDLTSFTVLSRPEKTDYAPVQPIYRGVIELDSTVESVTKCQVNDAPILAGGGSADRD